MTVLFSALGLFLIVNILVESFETLVLPRRIERKLRMTRLFYRGTWKIWTRASVLVNDENRDNFLSVFGPLSLLLLLSVWGTGLVLGFALLGWGIHLPLHTPDDMTFGTYIYLSATTFVTLGYGDVYPLSSFARGLCDVEASIGFGFLAIVVGYLPVLYGAFSRREVEIALLDARASSPPSAGELLRRTGVCPDQTDLLEMLRGYERWSAELLESHLSYPILMYYRSQHDRQSWLSALTTILDSSAYIIAAMPGQRINYQARMTFAISRHAAIDLALTFDTPPEAPVPERLTNVDYVKLCELLAEAGVDLKATDHATAEAKLAELRELYEPYVNSLSKTLRLALPNYLPTPNQHDNWQTSAWDTDNHFFQAG